MSDTLVKIQNLSRRFGRTQALQDVSLEIPRGQLILCRPLELLLQAHCKFTVRFNEPTDPSTLPSVLSCTGIARDHGMLSFVVAEAYNAAFAFDV